MHPFVTSLPGSQGRFCAATVARLLCQRLASREKHGAEVLVIAELDHRRSCLLTAKPASRLLLAIVS